MSVTTLLGGASFETDRVFCIGRNYAAHAAELGNEVPNASPVVFLKPATCLLPLGSPIPVPAHGADLQHEAEIVLLIGKSGRPGSPAEAMAYLDGLALGLDLTLRDVQSELKKAGLPWEKAKAFEASAPIGTFSALDAVTARADLNAIRFTCQVNGEIRQEGDTSLLLFPIADLLVHLGKIWSLRPGDLVYTGTPAGVGPLRAGDSITLTCDALESASWKVERAG